MALTGTLDKDIQRVMGCLDIRDGQLEKGGSIIVISPIFVPSRTWPAVRKIDIGLTATTSQFGVSHTNIDTLTIQMTVS